MARLLRRFLSDQNGATAIEYGLIASLLSVAIIAGFGVMSSALTNVFYAARDALITP